MKRFLKSALALCAVLCMSVIPAGIGSIVSAEDIGFSVSEISSESDNVILARYVGKYGDEYKFSVVRMIKGTAYSKQIYVTAESQLSFKKGSSYILFADSDFSVYYPHDKYILTSDAIITADDHNNIISASVDGVEITDFPTTVREITESVVTSEMPDAKYIRKTRYKDIRDGSDIIIRAVVGERISDSFDGCGCYKVSVSQIYKGKVGSEIVVILFDSAVGEGDEVYLLLSSEKTDGMYRLSSKFSCVDGSNENFISVITK